ncbi:hypothetical protein Tco_0924882, partial [Tanacetum coccineum]
MATTDKESSAAGTDNRPLMLEESDFESWKMRIERYIRGKPLGKLIWKSIKNGPSPHPMITVTTGEGEQQTQVTREKTDEEFTEDENNKERADIQATNILSQGLSRHIFNTLNQTKTAKEIWENVEILMQGSGLTEQQKKETLFDQYERFRANGNESIHDYFVRFHKLINDMKITKMEIPVHQRNTKFVNNLPSYWGKYVTIVKNSKDISTVSYVDLYTHLKSYEQHAMKTLSKMNQTSGNADPLAYMAQATQSTSSPSQYVPPPPQYAPAPQQAPQSTNDAMLATMNQIVNLLSGFQKQFPPTNNQLRTSTNPKTQATIQAGQITTESVQRRAPDAEDEAFLVDVECTTPFAEPLAITTTTTFEVSHEDAYDSDVNEAPHAAAVVSQEIHGGEQLDSDVDSVIDDHDNTIPYHQYQLNNKVESVPTDVSFVVHGGISVITILDNLRSQLMGHIKTNEEQSFANDSLKVELERYKTQVQNLEQSKVKKDLEQLVFERNKQNADLEEQLVSLKQQILQHVESNKSLKTKSGKLKADNNALEESYLEELVWPTFSIKDLHKSALGHRNPMYLKSAQLCRLTLYLGDVIVDPVHTPFRVYDSEEILVQAELSSEQVYWLPANEVASYNYNQSKPITTFVRTRPAKSQVNTQLKMLKACFPDFDKVVKDRTTPSYITNGEWRFEHTKKCFVEDNLFKKVSKYMKIFDELDKEYDQCVIDKKSLEIENKNLLIQNECLLAESVSKDICSIVLTSDIAMPMSVEPRSNCVKEHSRNIELEAEILKMKQLLVCNNSSSPEPNAFFEINKLKYHIQGKDELIRIKNDSLRDENVSIKKRYQDLYQSKAESNSNVSSRATVPKKPKVLAPGLYAMTSKYIPPQKRNNREANTPLPRKETVSLVKKTNVCVNLSIGIKYVTEASKSKSKCETNTHRNLSARSENVKRVDNPFRNLNKRNHVDSSLSVKRTGFTSKFVSVCKTCNECLVFGNHKKCGVKNLNYVNAKNPKVKNDAIVKQVWKATGKIFASIGSKWKPTRRKFTLGDTCPLTRITKPEVVPLEKSG